VLDAVDAFQGLDGAARVQVLQLAARRKFERGEAAFHQGAAASDFFVLLAGRLRMTKLTPEGQQTTLRYIGPKESFGCVAVCGNQEYPATATAAEDCWALGWTRLQTEALAERFPKIALNVMRVMSGRLEEVQARLGELAYDRVERRIAQALVRLVAQAGRRSPEGIVIDLALSRQDLAEYAGTTLATASRTLSAWEDKGIVAVGRQKVMIRSPHGLMAIAEDLPERES
jgi:CRP-like cAMP-binding protein